MTSSSLGWTGPAGPASRCIALRAIQTIGHTLQIITCSGIAILGPSLAA